MTRNQDLTRRAKSAYYRSGGISVPNKINVVDMEKSYVVLKFYENTLAVYRIENSGRLKGLKRWPALVASPLPKATRVTEDDVLAQVAERLNALNARLTRLLVAA